MKFINDIFEAMEARRKREEREAAIVFGGGCLIFIIIGIVMVIVGTIMNAVETANVNSIYGETYARTCQGMPAGQDSASNLTDAPSPRQILLLTANTQRRHAWHNELPTQWQAETEDEVSLIGCVEDVPILLETCEYERDARDGDTFTIRVERKQYETTVVLVNPNTARRIDSKTVLGAEPEVCPPDEDVSTSDTLYGESLTWDDFGSWVEGYIFS